MTSPFGGPTQVVARNGDRFNLQISLRPLSGAQGSLLNSILEQGLFGKLRISIGPQFFPTAGVGSPSVRGTGNAGRTCAAQGFSPGFQVYAGQYFNVVTNGIYSLYRLTAPAAADANGYMTLSFYSMLKQAPTDGDIMEFVSPQIEGFLDGANQGHTMDLVGTITTSISITEAI